MNVRLFLLQRGTAIILLPLVLAHLAIIILAVEGGLSAGEILGRTRGSLFWALFYGLFVAAASVHAAIGIRTVLAEWFSPGETVLRWVTIGYMLVLLAAGLRAVYAVVIS